MPALLPHNVSSVSRMLLAGAQGATVAGFVLHHVHVLFVHVGSGLTAVPLNAEGAAEHPHDAMGASRAVLTQARRCVCNGACASINMCRRRTWRPSLRADR